MSSLTLSSSPGPSTRSWNVKRSYSDISTSGEQPSSKKAKTAPASTESGRDKKKRNKKKKRKPSVVVIEDGRARVKGTRRGRSEPLVPTSPVIVKAGQSSRSLSKTPVDDISGDERDVEQIVAPAQGAEVVDRNDAGPEPAPGPSALVAIDSIAIKKDKGKGKAIDIPQRTAEEEIARLTRELAFKNSLLSKHKDLVAQTQQSIICQVCLELMYKPYALAPCGHLACYDCLVSWFTAPAPSDPDNHPMLNLTGRKKTCPHCRAVVRERPVQVWGLKDIVASHAKSELLDGNFLPPGVETEGNREENTDPFKDIFRKPGEGAMAHYHPHPAGVFAGGPGILDEEDGGLFRCYDCLHEIWDGVCTGCGREYGGEDDDFDIRDLTGTDSEDEEGLGGGLGWLGAGVEALAQRLHFAAHHQPDLLEGDEFDSDGASDGYESSFIDEDRPARDPRHGLHREDAVVLSSDSETDIIVLPPPPPPPQATASGIVDLSNSEDDEDEIEEVQRPRHLAPVAILSGSEGEDDEVEVVSSPPVARRGAVSSRNRRALVVVSSDSENDEEDQSDSGSNLVALMLAREREQFGDDGSRPRRHGQYDEDDDDEDNGEEEEEDDDNDDEDDEEGEDEDEALAY